MVERVLVYRLGSIGDTVISLPCFRLIARAFPDARRVVLTNVPRRARESSVEVMLRGTGLVHGYIRYSLETRHLGALGRLRAEIRRLDPQVLVYLGPARGLLKAWRDWAFFKACGVPRVVGAPLSRDLQRLRYDPAVNLWESEAHRLARCLAPLGAAQLDCEESWHLGFTPEEAATAGRRLAAWPGRERFIAACVGAKVPVKDWEEDNWRTLLTRLGERRPGLGLLFVGAAEDRERSARLEACWRHGPTLNLCGELSPRVSAAALAPAELYVGTDGGPMHLAASAGVPCVAVFSARDWPGEWFPQGAGHRVLMDRVPCMGCRLEMCTAHGKRCIRGVEPERVLGACLDLLPVQGRRETATGSAPVGPFGAQGAHLHGADGGVSALEAGPG